LAFVADILQVAPQLDDLMETLFDEELATLFIYLGWVTLVWMPRLG
jgi:hypothetical protein